MQKIVIDTNVMVSALIQKNYPFLIINDLFIENKFQLCVSEALLQEYYSVYNRPKFNKYKDFNNNAKNLISDIEIKSVYYTVTIRLSIIDDDADNRLLELAEISNADYLIT